jgi:hypothetical protein
MEKTISAVDAKQMTAFRVYLGAYGGKTNNPSARLIGRAMLAVKGFSRKDSFNVAARIWGL